MAARIVLCGWRPVVRVVAPDTAVALARLLLFAGLCLVGSAVLVLLGGGSATAAPTTSPHVHLHPGRSGHRMGGLLGRVGRLARSAPRPGTRAAGSPKSPASHRPRPEPHLGAHDGLTGSADRAAASVDKVVQPVAGKVATPLRPVTATAGDLLTSIGLVPVPGGPGQPPAPGPGSHRHHAVAPVASGHGPGRGVHAGHVVGAIATTRTAASASGAGSGHRDPRDQPAPSWPAGVAGGVGSGDTVRSGRNAPAGRAERVGAALEHRLVGRSRPSDDLPRQLDAVKPQVSPD